MVSLFLLRSLFRTSLQRSQGQSKRSKGERLQFITDERDYLQHQQTEVYEDDKFRTELDDFETKVNKKHEIYANKLFQNDKENTKEDGSFYWGPICVDKETAWIRAEASCEGRMAGSTASSRCKWSLVYSW
jgi:hypothetical protein